MKLFSVAWLCGLALVGCAVDGEQAGEEGDLLSVGQDVVISSNSTGTVGSWFYTFWKDGGTAQMDLQSSGNFITTWQAGTSYNYVGGPGWQYGSPTRRIGYNCGQYDGANTSSSYLTVYGWSKDPLVEYYILQSWGSYNPPCPGDGACTQGTTFTSNGVTYETWKTLRSNRPSILGTQTFNQYWSKPTTKLTAAQLATNREINFADHAAAWAANGWNLGTLNAAGSGTDTTYQVLAVEVFGPSTSGTANCTVWENAASSCTDGVQNGTETGVDCGGSCSACAAPVPGFQMANNEVVMLATSRTSTSTVGSDSFTVSGSDMQCTVDSGDAWTTAGAGPKMTFNVNFTSTGTFYIHLYGDGPNGAGNSAFAGVDGTAMGAFYDFPGTSTNVWRSQGTVNVTTTGAHTVSVWAREDGMKINKIVVNKSATAPTGSGPAQSTKL